MGKSKLILTPADAGLPLSREEFTEAEEKKPWRYERAQGRLVVMSPAGYEHHSAAEPFRNHLGAYKLSHPGVIEHVFQEAWVTVEEETDRIPDIAVYLAGGSGRFPQRVPDLVFEIVSDSPRDRQRDYEEKRGEYQRIGVREYVIVDIFFHRLTILRLNGEEGTYEETLLGPADSYTTPLLPGLAVPLRDAL